MGLHLALALQWKLLQQLMINLSARSLKKELLDSDNIPFADIKRNMHELNAVNTLLGGHFISIRGIRDLLPEHTNEPLIICEVGCGGGDNLSAISKWCTKNNIDAHFIGIDIKKECIDFAKQQYPDLNATWLVRDYKDVTFINKPAIIFSSLFCHHFTNDEIISMLPWMQQNSQKGFFINDLHRNTLAYFSIKWLTRLFSHSYLVKNDAPLSVARSFKKNDWILLLDKAGIREYTIQWKWAFRYLVVYKKNE